MHALLGVALASWHLAEPVGAPVILEVGRLELPEAAPGQLEDVPDRSGESGEEGQPSAPVASSPAAPEPGARTDRPETQPPTGAVAAAAPEPPADPGAPHKVATPEGPLPSLQAPSPDTPGEAPTPRPDAAALEALTSLTEDGEPEPQAHLARAPGPPVLSGPGRSASTRSWIDDALAAAPADDSSRAGASSGPRAPSPSEGRSGALSPELGGADASALALWQTRVSSYLMRLFRPPPSAGAGHDDLSCRVHIWIDPGTGDVQRAALAESSGIVAWDQAALRAVESAGALPVPPRSAAPLLSDGFAVKFVQPHR